MNVEAIIKDYEQARAEQHSAMVRRGIEHKASQGFLVGTLRFGYGVERTRCGSLARLVPKLAPFLRRAFEMVLEDYSITEIFDWLKAQGISGKRGNPISFRAVQKMLTNPYYAGVTKIGDGQLVRGLQEPLVDLGTFFEVQQRLRCNQKLRNHSPRMDKPTN